MLAAVLHSASSSPICASLMELVEYKPEYNPEALTNYYSCGVQIGRSKNPDVKDKIMKARNHLSALGWTFFYIWKKASTRRELRYRSPTGKTYISLRTACQALIDQQVCQDTCDHDVVSFKIKEVTKHETKLMERDESLSNSRPQKRIPIEDVESFEFDIPLIDGVTEEETRLVKKDEAVSNISRPQKRIRIEDVESFALDIPLIDGVIEQETRLVKKDEAMSNSRPKKKIRIEDVESAYFRQLKEETAGNSNDPGIANDEKKEGFLNNRPAKSLRKLKEVRESGKKINKFKPNKRIRKVKPSSVSRKFLLSQLIQRNIVLRGSRVAYRNRKDDRIMAQGRAYEEGIQCDCCNEFYLLSRFEAHAGSTYRRPAARIFLDDGRSLVDCQTQLNAENEVHTVTKSTELSDRLSGQDEFCSFCNDGGELVLCDSCTSSYHSACIGLNEVPDSEYWFCPSCCCGICHQGQISKITTEDSRDSDQIKCEQCERQFHIECLKKEGISVSCDAIKAFCSEKCERIFSGLTGISGLSMPSTKENLSWSLLKVVDENKLNEEYAETYSKLNAALDVMHECFEPVRHPWSDNNDVIEDVIYSKSSKRSNFRGFFTAVLEKDKEVVTVVTVRIHGCKAAEIPFVATRGQYQRLGLCRNLMEELEKKLGELGVERLVLPAVPEMVNTWTQSFGFKMMTESERLSLVECKFLDFPGTVKCQKILKRM